MVQIADILRSLVSEVSDLNRENPECMTEDEIDEREEELVQEALDDIRVRIVGE